MQNVYGKLMERIVAKTIVEDLKVFPTSMEWCHPGHDTTTNVLSYDVYKAFQNRKKSAITTLELKDAYNHINYQTLLSVMCDLEMQFWVIRWLSNALYERTVVMSCKTGSSLPIMISSFLNIILSSLFLSTSHCS
jgi:hypothetical protein